MDAIVKYPNRWTAGISGNPNGRPVGSRTAFSNAFLRDLAESWAEHGKATMVHTAKANPEVYFATCARLIPKDVQLTIEQTTPRGLDQSDMSILRAIKQSLPDANSRTPSEVLNYVLDAVRAHSSHQLIDATSEADTEGQNS
jgi:hypothetical protein